MLRGRAKTIYKNSVVATIQEEETDSKIPKLKKVILNATEVLDWVNIKKSFALTNDIWKNLDGILIVIPRNARGSRRF